MATLHAMHSDHVDHATLVTFMAMGLEMQMDEVAAERDRGTVPNDQIADVVYQDLVADPIATVETLYARWGIPLTDTFRAALTAYLDQRHTHRAPGHDYSFADTGLDLATHRQNVAAYQARYQVPSEV
jgi:hypothetical protein